LAHVDTWMNWAGQIKGRARVDVPDWSRTNLVLARHDAKVHDARPIADELSLDREGFVLIRHPTDLSELSRDSWPPHAGAEVGPRYMAAVAQRLKELVGADLVVPQRNGLLKRHAERAKVEGAIGPSRWVHMDYTRAYAPIWIKWLEDWQDLRLSHYPRVAIFQTWRCISPPPQDNTLAFCDASSLRPEDCIVFDACLAKPYDGPGNQFESQLSSYDPGQRWWYFPDLTADELIVFKGYDSDPARDAQPMHNSIDVPGLPGDVSPRVSIEARFFAFFGA
jgi:hypothetical protein